jgi:hypothetical protein
LSKTGAKFALKTFFDGGAEFLGRDVREQREGKLHLPAGRIVFLIGVVVGFVDAFLQRVEPGAIEIGVLLVSEDLRHGHEAFEVQGIDAVIEISGKCGIALASHVVGCRPFSEETAPVLVVFFQQAVFGV